MGIKFAVNEEFFNAWNHEMAYVLGYLYADGSLEDAPAMRGKYVRVTSVDRDRILAIKKLLNSQHTIVTERPKGNRKLRYLLRIGNSTLFNQLTKIGLSPHKSLTMKFPKIPAGYVSSFVRGYFDGDGCIFLQESKGKTQELIIKRLSTIFTSGSRDFLSSLHRILKDSAKVSTGNIYKGTRAKQLWFFTRDSVALFIFMYGDTLDRDLYMHRKYAIFEQYFKRRPSTITPEIRRILKKMA